MTDDIDALIGNWILYLNQGNPELIERTYAPDYVDHHPFPGYSGTLEGTIAAAEHRLRDENVKVLFEIDDCFAARDRVGYRVSGWGSLRDANDGAMRESFMLTCVGIFRIERSRLRERWGPWGYTPTSRRT